ncbi:MAG: radical SAM protein [Candidatus Woesearchaeota archaeon]
MVNALLFTSTKMSHNMYIRTSGSYRIATEIRKAGYTCQVIDFFDMFSYNEYKKIIDKYVNDKTLMIGFSNTFMNVGNLPSYYKLHFPCIFDVKDRMEYLISLAKNKNKYIKSVIGGPRTMNLNPEDYPYIDLFALGYADESVIEILHKIENEKDTISKNKIIDGYPVKPFKNFKFTESKIEWTEHDFIDRNETLPIEISRGCKFKCAFCNFMLTGRGNYKMGDYVKCEKTLYEEFMSNYEKYGTTNYYFCDETLNESIEKLEHLHGIIKKLPFKIQYSSFMRHDLIYHHKDMAEIMLDMGLRSAIFGIETFSDSAGKIIGKGLGQEKTKELLFLLKNNLWKNDVSIHSSFICGLPTESPEEFKLNILSYFSSPTCSLDSLSITPLFTFPEKNNENVIRYNLLSKFEKQKIFNIVNKDNITIVNDSWNSLDMMNVINEINNNEIIKQSRKISTWFLMFLLQFMKFDDIRVMKLEDAIKNQTLMTLLYQKILKYKIRILN